MDENRLKKYEPFWGSWHIKRNIDDQGEGWVYEIEKNELGNTYSAALKVIPVTRANINLPEDSQEPLSEADVERIREIAVNKAKEIAFMDKMQGQSNIVNYDDHLVIERQDEIGWDILIRMELLTPLKDYVTEQDLDESYVTFLGIDICRALEVCERYNIVHLDIKPGNIFISKGGDFKLGDFGIACLTDEDGIKNVKAGTKAYLAPEVYHREVVDKRADIYSLGLVMYQFLNHGRLPFYPSYPQEVSEEEKANAIAKRLEGTEAFAEPECGNSELIRIVMKACAFDPADRYQTPMEMRTALEEYQKAKPQMQSDKPQNGDEAVEVPVSVGDFGIPKESDSEDFNYAVGNENHIQEETEYPVNSGENELTGEISGQFGDEDQTPELDPDEDGDYEDYIDEDYPVEFSQSIKPVSMEWEEDTEDFLKPGQDSADAGQDFQKTEERDGFSGFGFDQSGDWNSFKGYEQTKEKESDKTTDFSANEQSQNTGFDRSMDYSGYERKNETKTGTSGGKKKKTVIIAALVAVIAFVILYITVISPSIKYNKAQDYVKHSQYDQALAIYTQIQGYKDSKKKITETRYLKAQYLFENGNYAKAQETYALIPDYKDSREQEALCANYVEYEKANQLFEQEEYQQAGEIYASLGDFEDAAEMVQESAYQYAGVLLKKKEFDKAIEQYESLSGYKDSKDQITECKYQHALAYYSDKNYKDAIDIWLKIKSYKDSQSHLDDARYLYGKQLIEQKDFAEAVTVLNLIAGYKDADDLIKSAKYGYAKANYNDTDTKTYTYLSELSEDNYLESKTLYDKLYQWKVTITVNNSENGTNNMTQLSRSDKWYFHYKVTGGPLTGGTILKYKITWPSGKNENDKSDEKWERGYSGSYYFWYTTPKYGNTGKMTLKIYDENDNLMGEASVQITK